MQLGLLWAGRALGVTGMALTAAAVVTRAGGAYQLGGFQAVTVLTAGTAAMVGACLAYVAMLAERAPRP
jgi:hypothetical protein